MNIAVWRGSAWQRAYAAWQPIALAAIAAALAWLIAHGLLGHPQPFFAPIAAAIALSTSPIQRARRTVQMVSGVLLGIGVGEALVALLGTGAASLGIIVFVTLHRHGTGGERALDAIVGGAVAFVLGVILFPAYPLTLLRDAERRVLRVLGDTLEQLTHVLSSDVRPDPDWTLRVSHEVHRELAGLAQARATGNANVRVAPRRWRLRDAVGAETHRVAQLDLLANAVLGLVRAAGTDIYGTRPLPDELRARLADLTDAIRRLAEAPQPWPPEVIASVERRVAEVIADGGSGEHDRGTIVASVLRAAGDDLAHVIDQAHSPGEKRAWRSL